MEIGGWVALAVLWALLNLMTKGQQKKRSRPKAPPLPRTPDATQQEGSRLEVLLREFERALEEGRSVERPTAVSLPRPEPLGRPPDASMSSDEEFEDRESLEREPEMLSLETEVRREARRRVDQDEDAEKVVARRISAASARDKAASGVDHAAFDTRIRQEPADKTATGYTARQLRDAVVWREILGPPVSLRPDQ